MTGHAARRVRNMVETGARTFEVKIASDSDEFEQAFLLLARKYQAKGYEDSGAKLFRFTPFHVLPETITVVALEGTRVMATVSLVPDTALLGLPLESIYPEEVAGFRREGRRMAEVTSLAEDGLAPREFLQVFVSMVQLIQQYHLRIGGDTWLATANPHHTGFYRKFMGTRSFGSRKNYPSVANAPAEAFVTDLAGIRARVPKLYDRLFGTSLPEAILTPPARPADHVDFFSEHSTAADRRTIRAIAEFVDSLGSPPRWWEAGDQNRIGNLQQPSTCSAAA